AGDPFNDPQAIVGGGQGYGALAGVTSVVLVSGTAYRINGTNFGNSQGHSKIFLAGWGELSSVTWANTVVSFNLPTGAPTPTTGNIEVDVPLFGAPSYIAPGDAMLIERDPSGASVGSLTGSAYSTSDGTTTGTVDYSWIIGDPAASTSPVLSGVTLTASAGFLFQGINYE